MANADRPRGFKFHKAQIGPSFATLRRYQASTATTRTSDSTANHGDLYIGDPVKLTAGMALVADSADTVVGVVAAVGKTPSNTFGETQGFNPDDLGMRYLPYDAAGYVWIVPAEGNLFTCQTAADADLVPGSALVDFNIVATGSHGSRTTGFSSAELAVATGGTADCLVVENNLAIDNDETLTNSETVVMFNTTSFAI
jgi:hypothetical protein